MSSYEHGYVCSVGSRSERSHFGGESKVTKYRYIIDKEKLYNYMCDNDIQEITIYADNQPHTLDFYAAENGCLNYSRVEVFNQRYRHLKVYTKGINITPSVVKPDHIITYERFPDTSSLGRELY